MYNESVTNDNLIKQHTSEPYMTKDNKKVLEPQNTIVMSEPKYKNNFFKQIKKIFNIK